MKEALIVSGVIALVALIVWVVLIIGGGIHRGE